MQQIIFIILLAVVALTQLGFGGTQVLVYPLAELFLFGLGILYLLQTLVSQIRGGWQERQFSWRSTPLNIPFFLFLLLGLLQIIPLPEFLLAWLSPHALEAKQLAAQLSPAVTDQSFVPQSWFSLTIYPYATQVELLKTVSYLLVFFLILNLVRTRRGIVAILYLLVGLGLFQLFYGLIQVSSSNPHIWWWDRTIGGLNDMTGTYYYRNHYAAFLEMAAPLCFGAALAFFPRRQQTQGPSSASFKSFILSPPPFAKSLLFMFLGIAIGAGMIKSGSRGAGISLFGGLVLTSIVFLFKPGYRKFAFFALGLGLVTLLYALSMDIDYVLGRFNSLEASLIDGKLATFQSILPAFFDFPLLGSGLGTFADAYMPHAIPGFTHPNRYLLQAHNDWLQIAVETGTVGLLIVVAGFLLFIFKTIRLLYRRNNFFAVGLGAAMLWVLLSLAIHSFFDFAIRNNANSLILMLILGMGYLALTSNGSRHSIAEPVVHTRLCSCLTGRVWRIALIVALSSMLLLGARQTMAFLRADLFCPDKKNLAFQLNLNPEISDIEQAIILAPSRPYPYERLASHFLDKETGTAESKRGFGYSWQALQRRPFNGRAWYALGVACQHRALGGKGGRDFWLSQADLCMDQVLKYRATDPRMIAEVVKYLRWRMETY